jgi:centromere protein C
MSGIFSSPVASPQHNGTLTSSDMQLQESSAPDVDTTLHARKTPILPPARAATPKHTNIGSPKRLSTARPHTTGKKTLPVSDDASSPVRTGAKTQPPANRKLVFDDGNVVLKSIENLSPFKPTKTLRRSTGFGPRPDPFASPERPSSKAHVPSTLATEQAGSTSQAPQSQDDGPLLVDDDDGYQPVQEDAMGGAEEDVGDEQDEPHSEQRARIESMSEEPADIDQTVDQTAIRRKRDRSEYDVESIADHTSTSVAPGAYSSESPIAKKQRRPARNSVSVLRESEETTINPTLLGNGTTVLEDVQEEETVQPELAPKTKKARVAAPKERDPNIPVRAQSSPAKTHGAEGGSKSPNKRGTSRGVSMGPVSNMALRATTPFEDATTTTRSGRNVIRPLQYWANETRVYKNGEPDGIIRAEEIEKPKLKKRKKKKARKTVSKLGDIEEESDTESTLADEWEDTVGVIAGNVARWDPETQTGDLSNPVHEGMLPPSLIQSCLADHFRSGLRVLQHHY